MFLDDLTPDHQAAEFQSDQMEIVKIAKKSKIAKIWLEIATFRYYSTCLWTTLKAQAQRAGAIYRTETVEPLGHTIKTIQVHRQQEIPFLLSIGNSRVVQYDEIRKFSTQDL